MATTAPSDHHESAGRLYAVLKSISKFDEIEVRGVMQGIINPTDRESCFQIIYHRAVANVASLIALNNRQHFQAISMITRNLFELAIDIRLIDKIADSITKMITFVDVEKLRCAQKIVDYKAAHATVALDDAIYQAYIANEGARIKSIRDQLWPSKKKGAKVKLDHWSALDLKSRADRVGPPFDQIYEVQQPRWSWQVHAGITGVANLKKETFSAISGMALHSCAEFYEQILLAIVAEFQLEKANLMINGKLRAARLMPFANNQHEADEVLRQLTR